MVFFEFFQGSDGFVCKPVRRIRGMQEQNVHVIGSQCFETGFCLFKHFLSLPAPTLCGHYDLVSSALDGLADDFLARSIRMSGVDIIDSQVECPCQDVGSGIVSGSETDG